MSLSAFVSVRLSNFSIRNITFENLKTSFVLLQKLQLCANWHFVLSWPTFYIQVAIKSSFVSLFSCDYAMLHGPIVVCVCSQAVISAAAA